MPARLLWYSLAFSTRKINTTATNSYTEYCSLFGKNAFSAQVGGLAAWIGHLGGRKLKPKTIKRYLAGLQSFCLNCTLDKTELEVYSHLILRESLLASEDHIVKETLQTLAFNLRYFASTDLKVWSNNPWKSQPTRRFCLAFAGFLGMRELTYDKVECDFNSRNLTQGSVSLLEDRLFFVLPAFKTDLFCWEITLTISKTKKETYAIKSLRNLFERYPQLHHHPLF